MGEQDADPVSYSPRNSLTTAIGRVAGKVTGQQLARTYSGAMQERESLTFPPGLEVECQSNSARYSASGGYDQENRIVAGSGASAAPQDTVGPS